MNHHDMPWERSTNSGWEALNAGNNAEAERLLRSACQIAERFGMQDERHIVSLRNISWLYAHLGRHDEAERLSRQRLPLAETTPGRKGRNLREAQCDIAYALRDQGKLAYARSAFKRAVADSEQYLGIMDVNLVHLLNELALIEQALGDNDAAKNFYRKELIILEQTQGPSHPSLVEPLKSYAGICQLQGRDSEAKALLDRSRTLGMVDS